MTIDLKSKADVTSVVSKGATRKVHPNLISFTKHAREQMKERDLKSGDVLNVLRAGKIFSEPEYENGSL